jgi:hypothetical protein
MWLWQVLGRSKKINTQVLTPARELSSDVAYFKSWNYLSIGISVYLAKRYGDRAGTDAAIAYEEQREERERVAALQALLNQVTLVRKIADLNSDRDDYVTHLADFVELPTKAFETAFVSEKPPLSSKPELLEAVNDYLSKAYVVNSSIDFLARIEVTPISENSREPQRVFRDIRDNCRELATILDELQDRLREAL